MPASLNPIDLILHASLVVKLVMLLLLVASVYGWMLIARLEQVEKWPRKDATDMIAANWDGIAEGLAQARRIIGAMWDELPVPQPQAVAEHNAKCGAWLSEQNA